MIYQGIRIKNKLLANAQKQAEEEKRKAAIERAKLEAAKESKKPELGKSCKFFYVRAQIRLRCEPNATREDAGNALKEIFYETRGEVLQKEIIYESHGEDLQIDRVIGE